MTGEGLFQLPKLWGGSSGWGLRGVAPGGDPRVEDHRVLGMRRPPGPRLRPLKSLLFVLRPGVRTDPAGPPRLLGLRAGERQQLLPEHTYSEEEQPKLLSKALGSECKHEGANQVSCHLHWAPCCPGASWLSTVPSVVLSRAGRLACFRPVWGQWPCAPLVPYGERQWSHNGDQAPGSGGG